MINEAERAILENFFSGTFHQDWDLDASNSKDVVAMYLKESGATPEQRRALSKAIENYMGQFKDDKELENKLFRELGSYYQPSADGLSAHQWLDGVARQLLDDPPN